MENVNLKDQTQRFRSAGQWLSKNKRSIIGGSAFLTVWMSTFTLGSSYLARGFAKPTAFRDQAVETCLTEQGIHGATLALTRPNANRYYANQPSVLLRSQVPLRTGETKDILVAFRPNRDVYQVSEDNSLKFSSAADYWVPTKIGGMEPNQHIGENGHTIYDFFNQHWLGPTRYEEPSRAISECFQRAALKRAGYQMPKQ